MPNGIEGCDMILFKKDWLKYPNAIPDYQTRNKSFLELAGLLKSMTVDNCEFPLALHNPRLQGVDPFDSNLTQVQIGMITNEIKNNPWYFFREVFRIPVPGKSTGNMITANRANISLWWLFFNHITTMLIQQRQTGKSLNSEGLEHYILNVAAKRTKIGMLTKDDGNRTAVVSRIKDMMDELPSYLKLKHPLDIRNTEHIKNVHRENEYRTAVARSSPKDAVKTFRGHVIPVMRVDEFAYVDNIDITLQSMLPATTAAREAAAETGGFYGTIFTTTPGFLSSDSGKYAYKIYKGMLRWSEKLFDCKNEKELEETIRRNNPSGRPDVLLEYSHRQLGFTDEWLRRRIELAYSESTIAAADYLLLWPDGNASSPIPKDVLEKINRSRTEPMYTTISRQGYMINWYAPAIEVDNKLSNRHLILGLDTSDAASSDYIGMCIRDASSGEVIATGMYNETNLISFSEFMLELVETYVNLTLVIERRSSAVAIIDFLIKMLVAKDIDPLKRIFNWIVNDMHLKPQYAAIVETPVWARQESVYDMYKSEFGYATSGSGRASRDNLYGKCFMASTKYTATQVRDKSLITQLSELTQKNNRIDHPAGGNDDMVIAWLLGYWFLLEAGNKSVYGIPPNIVLSMVNIEIVNEKGGAKAVAYRESQIEIKQQIDNLLEIMGNEPDQLVQTFCAKRARILYQMLDTSIIPNFNIDVAIANIKMQKEKTATAA